MLRYGESTTPCKKIFTNAGVDMGSRLHIFICPHFRIHLPNTAHLSCNSANIGYDLYNIVSNLSIYRLFFYKNQRFCLTKDEQPYNGMYTI